MTDISATLNGHGRQLSMNYEAVKKRAQRAGVPIAVQRERERDMGLSHVPRASPISTSRRQPRDIRLATSRDGPPRDVSGDGKAVSPTGTKQVNQTLKLVPKQVESPPLQPGQSTIDPPSRGGLRTAVAVLAVLFSLASIGTNSTYLVSQGTDSIGMFCLGLAALCYELGLVVMPTVLVALWGQRNFMLCFWAFLFTFVCFMTAVYAATGFVNANFGDTEARRSAEQKSHIDLRAQLDRMLAERRAIIVIPTSREVADLAAATVKRDCPSYNRSDDCKAKRSRHESLVEQIARNEKAAELDTKIPALQSKLEVAPTAKWADPQIEGVVALLSGAATKHHAETGRIIQFIALPIGAGLLWAFFEALGALGRRARVRPA